LVKRNLDQKSSCYSQQNSLFEVEVSSPTVGIIEKASENKKNEMTVAISMVAACANTTENEVRALELKDFTTMQKVVEGFLVDAGLQA
jgi:hypothetical protein